MESDNQLQLFKFKEWWEEHWQDMPEFVQNDEMPFRTIKVHFRNHSDVKDFLELLGIKVTNKTLSIWFPQTTVRNNLKYQYIDES